MKKMKPGAKLILAALLLGAAVFLINKFVLQAPKNIGASQVVGKFQLSTTAENPSLKADQHIEIPVADAPAVADGTAIIWQVMAWNAQFPLMYANGGVQTVLGSLFAKAGVNVTIKRQDDCNQTCKDFVANAAQIHDNPNTVPLFITFMGDGIPGYSNAFSDLSKYGKDYVPVAFYPMGRSNGEDGFWGPAAWKQDPKNSIGGTVVGVERDGDLNIVIKWAADNAIPINANTKYYDGSALNIVPSDDYVKTGQLIIAGATSPRKIMIDGKTTNKDTTVGIDAYASWTPVDVTVAQKKGGLVKLASTKDYTAQMPAVTLVLKSWADAHEDVMVKIIIALGQAGDQIKSFPDAQLYAATVSAKVYADPEASESSKPEFWLKYWKGITEKDVTGMKVQLGGSAAFNLADAANMFGLGADGVDRYKVTYESFGNALAKLYPDNMKGWKPYADIIDKKFFILALATAKTDTSLATGTATAQTYSSEVTTATSEKNYNIAFKVGSADLLPAANAQIKEIYSAAVIAGGLTLQLVGHTDNTGNEDANKALSLARAQAVRAALIKLGLPASQVAQSRGAGSDEPIDGTTASDVRNRCVSAVLGN